MIANESAITIIIIAIKLEVFLADLVVMNPSMVPKEVHPLVTRRSSD